MSRKKILALQPVKSAPTKFLEREISLTLEQGGRIRLTFCGDNIAGCIAGIITAVEGAHGAFESECPVGVTFRYWHIDEDLHDLTIEAGAHDSMNGGETVVGWCRRLVAQGKMQFTATLARQQITLKGPLGELEAA
jgi:hypothetical protein